MTNKSKSFPNTPSTPTAIVGSITRLALEDFPENEREILWLLDMAKEEGYTINNRTVPDFDSLKGIDFKQGVVTDPQALYDSSDNYVEKVQKDAVALAIDALHMEASSISQNGSLTGYNKDKVREIQQQAANMLTDIGYSVMDKKATFFLDSQEEVDNAITSMRESNTSVYADVRDTTINGAYSLDVWFPERKQEEVLSVIRDSSSFSPNDDRHPELDSIGSTQDLLPGLKDQTDLIRKAEIIREFNSSPSLELKM